jgi:hypothetical protein
LLPHYCCSPVPERGWLLLQLRPDGALLLVPQAQEHQRRAADHHRRRRRPGPAGDRAPRRVHRGHPVREPHLHHRRAQGRRGGGPAAGGGRRHHQQAGGRRDRRSRVTAISQQYVAHGWTEAGSILRAATVVINWSFISWLISYSIVCRVCV